VTFFKKTLQQLIITIQFFLVFLFILFEEIIWERVAEPIYDKIQSLKILQKLKILVKKTDRYTLLVIFLFFLLGVEGAGILAGILFIKGKLLLSVVLYICKVSIASFTFWLFKVSKSKLLSFKWFAWGYSLVMDGIEWIKSTDIYHSSIALISKLKTQLKNIKKRFFSKENKFLVEIKLFYRYLKKLTNRK